MMREEGVEDLLTFYIGFEDRIDELEYAEMVAKRFGTRHHSRLVTAADALAVPDLAEQFDEPFCDISFIPTYYVSRLAREHVAVALSGDGGDELFAGYTIYRSLLGFGLLRPVPRIILDQVSRLGAHVLAEGQRGAGFVRRLGTEPSLLQLELSAPPLAGFCREALSEDFQEFLGLGNEQNGLVRLFSTDGTPTAAMLKDQRNYLVDDILTKVDRMSMAVSLEARVPLLDHVFADYVNSLPISYKLNFRDSKRVFRHALRDVLPEPVLQRPKVGFHVPLRSWLLGPLREWSRDVLMENCPTLFDEKGVNQLFTELQSSRRDMCGHVFKLVALGIWARKSACQWEGKSTAYDSCS
jgi:asparagine synthase (glutamine-hydrolysing)